jgi:hypothetical protein
VYGVHNIQVPLFGRSVSAGTLLLNYSSKRRNEHNLVMGPDNNKDFAGEDQPQITAMPFYAQGHGQTPVAARRIRGDGSYLRRSGGLHGASLTTPFLLSGVMSQLLWHVRSEQTSLTRIRLSHKYPVIVRP